MDQKHRGAQAELIACTWLLEQGYEVFRNISAHGPADLIAWKPETGETIKVDVKTPISRVTKSGELKRYTSPWRENQQGIGLKMLLVDNGECYWAEPNE